MELPRIQTVRIHDDCPDMAVELCFALENGVTSLSLWYDLDVGLLASPTLTPTSSLFGVYGSIIISNKPLTVSLFQHVARGSQTLLEDLGIAHFRDKDPTEVQPYLDLLTTSSLPQLSWLRSSCCSADEGSWVVQLLRNHRTWTKVEI